MSEIPESAPEVVGSAPEVVKSAPSQGKFGGFDKVRRLTLLGQPTVHSRSIHPNVSLTRAMAPEYNDLPEPEHSRVSTASSVGTNFVPMSHPNISQVADQRAPSQQTSWTHPNVQINRSKRYSRFPQPVRDTNNCQPRPPLQQCPSPVNDQPNSSSGPLTSGSSCSQSSPTERGYSNCSKFSQTKRSRPKSGGSGCRVRPKSSRAQRQKSLRQLKFQEAPYDSFNCNASASKLVSKSSSCIPRTSHAATIPARSRSSCMSMGVCSDCREAHGLSSTASCQSSDICEYCGAPKRPSGQTTSSGLPSCDSEGDCSDCAGSHRTQPSCQSMAVCSGYRTASRSPSQMPSHTLPSRTPSHPSMNSQQNVQVRSAVNFSNGPSRDSARICEDCARKCAAGPCSSISICQNCSKAFTPVPSRLANPSSGLLGRQQQDTIANPSIRSMNASRTTVQASCGSCGSKLSAPVKPSCCNAGSKAFEGHPQQDCDCQHSEVDLSKLKVSKFISQT